MAFRFRAHRARYLVLACLLAVSGATLWSFLARRHGNRPEAQRPAPMAEDVSQHTQAFSLSKTLGEHTLYTIHAEEVTNYEANGKAALHGVSVLIFGKGGTRHDRITAAECLYDPTSASIWVPGDVEMQFDVPLEQAASAASPPHAPSSTPVSIHTSKLAFDQNSGIASTDAPVHFQFAQGEGSATGAVYDPQQQMLTLKSQVDFDLAAAPGKQSAATSPGDHTRVRADSLRYDRGQGRIFLENSVDVTNGTRRVRAARGELLLKATYDVDEATLQGDVLATDDSPSFAGELRTKQAYILFGQQGKVSELDAIDSVNWKTNSLPAGQSREGQAQHVAMFFHEGTGALERAVADGQVRMIFRKTASRASNGNSVADTQIITGERAEMQMLPEGKAIDKAAITTSAVLIVEPSDARAERRTVTADRFDIGFFPDAGISNFRAQNGVRLLSETTAGTPRKRETTSDTLDAMFDPATGVINRMNQRGKFNYRDADRQARAQEANYVVANNSIVLLGEPIVWDADGRLTARQIDLQTVGGGLTADGNVAATFVQKAASGAQPGEPLHAVADRLTYDGTQKISHFQQHARLWQGESFLVEGDSISWNPQAGELQADKKVYSVFRQNESGPGSKKSASPASGTSRSAATHAAAAGTKDDSVTIRADSFVYRHPQRLAHYEGGVQMQNATGIVTASQLDIFLQQPASQSSADISLSTGQIERAVAKDQVRIAEGSRVGTGDRAEYLPALGEVHLFGQLAKVSDPSRGSAEGPELTYFLGDDRIQVQGSPGLPTETRWQVHP